MRFNLLAFLVVVPVLLMAQPVKKYELNPVTVSADKIVDTAFGTWKFSVADYQFYKGGMILLTYQRSLKQPTVMIIDAEKRIRQSVSIPDEATGLYTDYQGYTNVICESHIYRLLISDNSLRLGSLPVEDYRTLIMPCIDSLDQQIYFSNYQRDYPEFTYYAYRTKDSSLYALRTITDDDQLKSYNMEYYFLPTQERFKAAKISREYGIDKHRVAAIMSGVTGSMYYTPLYAPLFIIHDSIMVFDHYKNAILKYNKNLRQVDSVPISYNHPKNWREWKQQVLVDDVSNDAYAVYQKNGYVSLNKIDLNTGKVIGSYKLANAYVDKLKVHNGYVYYVYSPFESLQEFFVYRELIII